MVIGCTSRYMQTIKDENENEPEDRLTTSAELLCADGLSMRG